MNGLSYDIIVNVFCTFVGAILMFFGQRIYWFYKFNPYLKKIDELEKKYIEGWHPDNICKACHKGIYVFKGKKTCPTGSYGDEILYASSEVYECNNPDCPHKEPPRKWVALNCGHPYME